MSDTSGDNSMGGNVTSNGNSTVVVAAGPNIIQVGDFYQKASVLHPLVVGSIAVIFLFTYLRIGSNRSVAPITVFDWIINVALGSTLAGVVNGTSLVRGIEALVTMLLFQYLSSYLSSNFPRYFERLFQGRPLVIAFRGKMLTKIMAHHRISQSEFYSAMRQQGILNTCQIECAIIEANGSFSIFTTKQLQEADFEPTALEHVPAYMTLVSQYAEEGEGHDQSSKNGSATKKDGDDVMSDQANEAANKEC